MSDLKDKINEHFQILVPKLASRLRDDFEKVEFELISPDASTFITGTFFLELKFWLKEKSGKDKEKGSKSEDNKHANDTNGNTVTMRFLAKTPIINETIQELANLDKQFQNEVAFYRNYASDGENFPKCIYIEDNSPGEITLILEDLSKRGYSVLLTKANLPLDDVLVAIKEIAKFHAKGYAMKEQHPEKFFQMISDIQECRYEGDGSDTNNHFVYLINHMTNRSVYYLRKNHYDRRVCDKLEEYFKDAYRNVIKRTIEPVEPLAVLCHGDFTVNNVLFAKDENESRAMLIDFALIRYGSPTIDLSTFLCLSGSRSIRDGNLPTIMRTYHDELTRCLRASGVTNLERYSYEAFWKDYVDHALFGFVVASFFLHTLMGEDLMPLHELLTKEIEEIVEINMTTGGEKVSKELADMLLDLKELGCFDDVLR